MVSVYTIDFMKLSCFEICGGGLFSMFLPVCVLMIDVDISSMSLLDCKLCPLSVCSISFLCFCLCGDFQRCCMIVKPGMLIV